MSEPSKTQLLKGRRGKYIRLAVTTGLLIWVATHTDLENVARAFTSIRIEWWLGALGILFLTQCASAWRWQLLASPFGFQASVRRLFGYYLVGMYFNLMLPTSVGGDVVRAWYLDEGRGRRLAALATVFLDRFSGLIALLALACIGVVVSPLELPLWIVLFVWGAAGCGAVCIAAAAVLTWRGKPLTGTLERVRLKLKKLSAPSVILGSTLLSLGVQSGNVVLVWMVGQSIGAEIPAGYYWIFVPMVSLLTMLPLSINGMGVREGAMVLFLGPLGVAKDPAVTLSLLWFSVFLAASLLGGLVYLFGRFAKPQVNEATTDDTEVNNGSVNCCADQGRARQHQAAL